MRNNFLRLVEFRADGVLISAEIDVLRGRALEKWTSGNLQC